MENKVKQAGPINLLHGMPHLSFLDVYFFYQKTRINLVIDILKIVMTPPRPRPD